MAGNADREQYALQVGKVLLEVSEEFEVFPPLEGYHAEVDEEVDQKRNRIHCVVQHWEEDYHEEGDRLMGH